MKLHYLCLVFLLVFLISDVVSEKPRKQKKYRRGRKPVKEPIAMTRETPNIDKKNVENDVEKPIEGTTDDNDLLLMDPCLNVHCGAGRICQLDNTGEPQCICIPSCPDEIDQRRKICSNHNETWSSDCAVYQQRCLCETKDEKCKGEQYRHVHIDYYGECRDMPDCSKEELVDFPRRMRDWLFNIMRDLADREELSPHYLKMEREAESNMTRRWINAAIWKFCELDGNPPDRSVSRHELFPIRAPLMSLEHCIGPFLNQCDADDNHRITIKEWADCLQLNEDEIEDQCEAITDDE